MKPEEIEDLFIRSLDTALPEKAKSDLNQELSGNDTLAGELSRYALLRETILRKEAASFGPYFAQKVITKIQNLGVEIDRQIGHFFKKYQLAAIGVLIALLAVNAVFSDQINIYSVFGMENDPSTELVTFDFYQNLNDAL